MGNRIYLYLRDDTDDARSFAEGMNHFPLLWRLLLADGQPGESITCQRVFGDDGSPNLVADARDGLERLRRVAAFMATHPRLDLRPELAHYFEAAVAYAEDELAALDATGTARFSADMQELVWVSGIDWSMDEDECDAAIDDSIDTAIADFLTQCNTLWQAIDRAITSNDVAAFDRALDIEGRAFADWNHWAWSFGLGGLDHPYFDGGQPRACRWADYQPESRHTDVRLGRGLYRFEQGGRFGVRAETWTEEPEPAVVVRVAAEWDAIEPACLDESPMLWVQRGERWGLLQLAPDGAPALVHPLDLTDTGLFVEIGGRRVAIVCTAEGVGILRADGNWLLAPGSATPALEELWEYENGYALARSEAGLGFIDAQGRWCVAPRFDDATHATASGLAVVSLAGRQRLVSMADAAIGVDWDGIQVQGYGESERFDVHRDGQRGWLHADGSPWIAAEWDELEELVAGTAIRCRRHGLDGLLDWHGNVTLAPRFEQLLALPNNFNNLPLLQARSDGRVGVIGIDGSERVPLAYDRVSAATAEGAAARNGTALVLLVRESGGRRMLGAWDIALGREVIACEVDLLHPLALYQREDGSEETGYLVGVLNPVEAQAALGRYRLGLRRRDGSELHPTAFVWIGDDWEADVVGRQMIGAALARAWNRKLPACALEDERYVWLHRDGRRQSHIEWLADRHAAGDTGAALRLARNLRDGEGVYPDALQARVWFARAAGLPASSIPDHVRGPLARLLRRDRHDWLPPANGDGANADPDALYELAALLCEGIEERPRVPAARALLEHLLQHVKPNHRDALVLLGQLLRDHGEHSELARAIALFERAARMQCANGAYELARAHHHGWGVAPDLEAAVRHYREAGKRGHVRGYIEAAFAQLALLARITRARQREHQARELVRLLELALAGTDASTHGPAYLLLGQCQAKGLGCPVDLAAAEASWLAGVEAGNVYQCAAELAALYARSDEDWNDPEREAYWRERARV